MNLFWLTLSCGIVPVILTVLIVFMPESPIYYLKTFRQDEARRSLQWFRGKDYDVEPELLQKKSDLDKVGCKRIIFM